VLKEIGRIRAEYADRAQTIPADRYSWTRPEIQFWRESTSRALKRLLPFPLAGKHVADIGCGTGQWLEEFTLWGATPANLHGIDLLEDRASESRRRLRQSDIHCGDASKLPWPDGQMDLISQFTVFSSILDREMRESIAREMCRVLKPGGHILWYDCRYSSPVRPAVRGLNREAIRKIFPNSSIRFASTTLLPPLSRAIAKHSWRAAAALEAIPLMRTHLAALITPDYRR
jgi:ubiquinone/menaquinone biosynthesis C-methylase UbiE